MHTFIDKDRLSVSVEDLGYDYIVSTPSGAILTIGVCERGVVVLIHLHILLTNFTMLLMKEFKAIFSMYCMTQHHVLIDC